MATKNKMGYFWALFSQSSHLPVRLLKALQLQVNICSKGIQSMQESGGMGGGSAARLCGEDSFSSRLKALTKLYSARAAWLGQIITIRQCSEVHHIEFYKQRPETTVQLLVLYIRQHTEMYLIIRQTIICGGLTHYCMFGWKSIHGDWKCYEGNAACDMKNIYVDCWAMKSKYAWAEWWGKVVDKDQYQLVKQASHSLTAWPLLRNASCKHMDTGISSNVEIYTTAWPLGSH